MTEGRTTAEENSMPISYDELINFNSATTVEQVGGNSIL